MRTKWFKYPKEIPHETGFYTVRGIREEGTNFEEDAYWDGNKFKCWDLEDEVYKAGNEAIKKWTESSSRLDIAVANAKGNQRYCNGMCAECKDYVKCSNYLAGDWCDFKNFSPYVDEEDEDESELEWEDYE